MFVYSQLVYMLVAKQRVNERYINSDISTKKDMRNTCHVVIALRLLVFPK